MRKSPKHILACNVSETTEELVQQVLAHRFNTVVLCGSSAGLYRKHGLMALSNPVSDPDWKDDPSLHAISAQGEVGDRMCPLAEEWVQHLQKQVELTVDSGADGVIYDDVHILGYEEPDEICFCARCLSRFNQQFAHSFDRGKLVQSLRDPSIFEEWLKFRSQIVLEFWDNYARHGHQYAQRQGHEFLVGVYVLDCVCRWLPAGQKRSLKERRQLYKNSGYDLQALSGTDLDIISPMIYQRVNEHSIPGYVGEATRYVTQEVGDRALVIVSLEAGWAGIPEKDWHKTDVRDRCVGSDPPPLELFVTGQEAVENDADGYIFWATNWDRPPEGRITPDDWTAMEASNTLAYLKYTYGPRKLHGY